MTRMTGINYRAIPSTSTKRLTSRTGTRYELSTEDARSKCSMMSRGCLTFATRHSLRDRLAFGRNPMRSPILMTCGLRPCTESACDAHYDEKHQERNPECPMHQKIWNGTAGGDGDGRVCGTYRDTRSGHSRWTGVCATLWRLSRKRPWGAGSALPDDGRMAGGSAKNGPPYSRTSAPASHGIGARVYYPLPQLSCQIVRLRLEVTGRHWAQRDLLD